MNPQVWNTKRRLVPRWRSIELTTKAGELGAFKRITDKTKWEVSEDLKARLEAWRRKPGLYTAAELLESAIVEGVEEVAVHAARRLVFMDRFATPLIKEQATRVLERTGHGHELPETAAGEDKGQIAFWRARTRLHPRDPLSWVELSRVHTIAGHPLQAQRAMRIASSLAPDSRHVLRSASRLYLHLGDPERAHDIIHRSPATKGDPWLLAAEISLAELASKSPRLTKPAHVMLEAGYFPRVTTELAGALATAELVGGNTKRAKRLFDQSMIDPTGNALAQAEWASPLLGGWSLPRDRYAKVDEASEAQAFHYYREEKYSEVGPACELWANEECYSVRPFEFGAAVAGLSRDFTAAIDFTTRGLAMRPGSPKLHNSQAFAMASLGRLDDAERSLAEIDPSLHDQTSRNVTLANLGLIAFRRGAVDQGQVFYRDAMAGFQRNKEPSSQATAHLYLARETLLASTPGSQSLADDAMKGWRAVNGEKSFPVLDEIKDLVARAQA